MSHQCIRVGLHEEDIQRLKRILRVYIRNDRGSNALRIKYFGRESSHDLLCPEQTHEHAEKREGDRESEVVPIGGNNLDPVDALVGHASRQSSDVPRPEAVVEGEAHAYTREGKAGGPEGEISASCAHCVCEGKDHTGDYREYDLYPPADP